MTKDYFDDAAATFGDRMAAARDRLGLTQAQLAQRIGVKAQTIAAWEQDRAEPRANRLQMLAGMLNVSMVWLMTGAGEGVAAPGAEPRDAALLSALGALRETRLAHARVGERLARLENQVQALVNRA
ncbi:MAG: transcriptional regulator [Rhodobacterales bacterium CG18_big_fil_WC_8_21_14_2_50_71_9]|nr:MAG: transcriptional regulator [Rhodobacterales bacterium CG18_big_fil_WC_8_21_14_2_50_71_9]PIY72655.1 MAG: transcriptional regulator [Rhodobacterales bacterium CG_4_10_14_0_8_um_filter_70_9]PJA60853.1 MAG: transcriptional regulator [Rhodobacterales bacterium CG_4_9_14_3_um_filter_71_31]